MGILSLKKKEADSCDGRGKAVKKGATEEERGVTDSLQNEKKKRGEIP